MESKGRSERSSDYFYSAGTSALLNNNFTRANKSFNALARLSTLNELIAIKKKKLGNLIADISNDNDKNYIIKKVNSVVEEK